MTQKEEPSEDPMNPDNYDLNPDQWSFMYLHYPEHCMAPFNMMMWLYQQAKAKEDMYAPPQRRGQKAGGDGDDSGEEQPQMAKDFRMAGAKAANASVNKKTAKQ